MHVQSCEACCTVDSALLGCSISVSAEYIAASQHGSASALSHYSLLCSVREELCSRTLISAILIRVHSQSVPHSLPAAASDIATSCLCNAECRICPDVAALPSSSPSCEMFGTDKPSPMLKHTV